MFKSVSWNLNEIYKPNFRNKKNIISNKKLSSNRIIRNFEEKKNPKLFPKKIIVQCFLELMHLFSKNNTKFMKNIKMKI